MLCLNLCNIVRTMNYWPDYQSAYRKGYSCETCNLKLANDILCNMEVQQVTPTILLDLSATFDTVDHDLLIQILEKELGIKGTALDWYKHYLYPRDFRVCVGNKILRTKGHSFQCTSGFGFWSKYILCLLFISV